MPGLFTQEKLFCRAEALIVIRFLPTIVKPKASPLARMQFRPFRRLPWLRPALGLLLVCMVLASPRAVFAAGAECPPLLQHRVPRLQDEKPQDLCQFSGKVLLVVNTASYCGFTPQYRALEALYERYKTQGLVVLGFPSNDFGSQEPGSNVQIAEFCENTFAVRFPMFVKTSVSGRNTPAHPLFEQLALRTGQRPQWNFHKYLIARDGQAVLSYPSRVDPESKDFVREVGKLLGPQ